MKYAIITSLLLLSTAVMGGNLKDETPIIRKAAERNNIKYQSNNWYLLLAIRKAENGRTGREFGIMNTKANNLNKQAGWASATIIKHHKRTGIQEVNQKFINSLADRYCPKETDPQGNINWKKNVSYFFTISVLR